MGCLVFYDKAYKGEIIKMSNNTQTEIQSNNPQSTVFIAESTIKVLVWILGIGIPTLIGFLAWIGISIVDLKTTTATNDNKISSMQEDINTINSGLNGDSTIKGIYTRLTLIENELGIKPLAASNEIFESINEMSILYNNVPMVASPLSSKMEIGIDENGQLYYADDLVDKTVLLTYMEGNNSVYFLGQYNASYHWDGLCITNVYYPDGTLFGICESNFDDGKRLDYKSICLSDSSETEWIFSERVCEGDRNIGINANYFFSYEKVKNFTNTNVRIVDILQVDEFLETIDYTMTRYYCGNTSDKLYNDTTGLAYLVIYDKDGTVKTLYYGNFVDGEFEDSTGDAWDIAYYDEEKCYVYNYGKFQNNHYVDGSGESKMYLTIEQIDEIISGYDFECVLNWKSNEDTGV